MVLRNAAQNNPITNNQGHEWTQLGNQPQPLGDAVDDAIQGHNHFQVNGSGSVYVSAGVKSTTTAQMKRWALRALGPRIDNGQLWAPEAKDSCSLELKGKSQGSLLGFVYAGMLPQVNGTVEVQLQTRRFEAQRVETPIVD